ncbi:MAG: hypothetical protein K8W52_24040, partial [Deltaproteobacteria bacterium]|nr:hypothetical protein [Deltaproteobacteria bacterium]
DGVAELARGAEVAVIAPAGSPVAEVASRAAEVPVAAPARSRRWIPIGIALVAAGALAFAAWPRGGEPGEAQVAIAPVAVSDAREAVAVVPAAAAIDAAVVLPPDAASAPRPIADDGRERLAPDRRGEGRPPHALAPVDAAPAMAAPIDAGAPTVRRVTIGATPWANFTIDDNPTQHQTPETVELGPGRHVVHFDNPELHVARDVTIDVPVDRDLRHVEPMSR